MECVFPAIFTSNDDGSYTITFPDLPGCISEGKSLENSLRMASLGLAQWLAYLSQKGEPIPSPRDVRSIRASDKEFTSLVRAELKNTRAVKRTVSIPSWMDQKASDAGLSLSRVLQDALNKRLQ